MNNDDKISIDTGAGFIESDLSSLQEIRTIHPYLPTEFEYKKIKTGEIFTYNAGSSKVKEIAYSEQTEKNLSNNYEGVKNKTLSKLMLAGIALSFFTGIILRVSEEAFDIGIVLYIISVILNLFLTIWAIVRLWNIDSMIGVDQKLEASRVKPTIEKSISETDETTEDKLLKSKKLYDEGLLTDESYKKLNLDLAQKLK